VHNKLNGKTCEEIAQEKYQNFLFYYETQIFSVYSKWLQSMKNEDSTKSGVETWTEVNKNTES
jgi:hypothetical protein